MFFSERFFKKVCYVKFKGNFFPDVLILKSKSFLDLIKKSDMFRVYFGHIFRVIQSTEKKVSFTK